MNVNKTIQYNIATLILLFSVSSVAQSQPTDPMVSKALASIPASVAVPLDAEFSTTEALITPQITHESCGMPTSPATTSDTPLNSEREGTESSSNLDSKNIPFLFPPNGHYHFDANAGMVCTTNASFKAFRDAVIKKFGQFAAQNLVLPDLKNDSNYSPFCSCANSPESVCDGIKKSLKQNLGKVLDQPLPPPFVFLCNQTKFTCPKTYRGFYDCSEPFCRAPLNVEIQNCPC